LAALGSIVGVRLMTGALSPAVYGELALAVTFVSLITQILIGPLSASFTRYLNVAQEKNELPTFLGSGSALALRISLTTLLLFAAGAIVLWVSGNSALLGLAGFTLIFTLLSGINILLDSIQTAARQRAVVAWHQGVGQWLRYLAAVGLIYLLGKQPGLAMAGYALSALLILGSQAYFFHRKFSALSLAELKVDPLWTRRILDYSLPFATWGIFAWLQLSSDRWALQTFSSTQAVGFYSVLYQLGYYPLMMLANVFAQFAEPVLFRQAGDGTEAERVNRAQRNTWRLLGGGLGLTALAVIAAALLHGPIFGLLAAPEYGTVSALLPVMVLSGGIFACGQIASMAPLNRGRSKDLVRPKIVTALAGMLANVAGAYWMGLPGVVYASTAFSVVYFGWVLLLSRKSDLR
jgi:O-antigen/teichoic acid export membrane protein